MNEYEIVIKTMYGLEEVLAEELRQLGAKDIKKHTRAVSFRGDDEMLYKANYYLRTALKVLKKMYEFTAKNEAELYDGVYNIDWYQHIRRNDTIAVETNMFTENYNNSLFVAQRIKDAIVDQIRKKTGRRPSVDLENPSLRIHAYLLGDKVELSFDSSGMPLFKRGYRIPGFDAPLNEVLAAGMVLLSGWNGQCALYDVMCGSGTILVEAALIAMNVPPGVFRKKFGFEDWPDFNSELFEKVCDTEYNEKPLSVPITGSDMSHKAISYARRHAENTSLQKKITFIARSLSDLEPDDNGGMVIVNPPYDKRIKSDNIIELYKDMGDTFKRKFEGFTVWMITSNYEAMKCFGLHPSKKITLYNGSLECKFLKYDIYRGTRKGNRY